MGRVRRLEAVLCATPGSGGEERVLIPLAAHQGDDAPATLVDPLPEFPGSWARETGRHVRPARYVRIS
ncbi:MAG: hypothetical protein ACTHJL_00285 [Amnibacterium sp.]